MIAGLRIAYMSVLRNAAELHQAPWLWLSDLSLPDPLHVLPLLIIGSMVLTQCITPAPGMARSQRWMFALLMPAVMGLSLWHYASGLSLYWVDRAENGESVHMEDFAQVFGLYPRDKYKHRSYANIAAVLWAETGEAGAYEFFKRLVFSVLIGNGDMHLKNWSLLYPDSRTPVLSPAYDFVATFPYIPNDSLALSFSDSRSLGTIEPDQVRRFAETARMPATPIWKLVREVADRIVSEWERLAEKDLLPSALLQKIDTQIRTTAKEIK